MRKFMIRLFCVIMLIAIEIQPVFAEVYTTEKTEGFGDCIYVAGSTDQYPIEFYDEDKKVYCGIIPDILGIISAGSGVDFVYINGNKADKSTLGENLQVEIVSSSADDSTLPYYKDYLELVSFEKDGETVSSGLIFTRLSDDTVISKIKTAANEIPEDVKSGIYLSYAVENTKINYIWLALAGGTCLLLVIAVILLIFRIKRIYKENAADKMTDSETGMGNLQFFRYHFHHTISDISRSLYHIAYIVLDSSYLRSYHGDSSFEDVLKYTASVLSEYTGDREISARITENGFAFAFQSTNDDDAQKRLTEIMNKLNSFEKVEEKNNKLVFHAAVYHLGSSDRNCEILLFNLRKNCNRIFGTKKQIIYCDTHSMNIIQEEKKITENILKGFEKNEFKMYLQFVVDNKTKKLL